MPRPLENLVDIDCKMPPTFGAFRSESGLECMHPALLRRVPPIVCTSSRMQGRQVCDDSDEDTDADKGLDYTSRLVTHKEVCVHGTTYSQASSDANIKPRARALHHLVSWS
jgi:hypothetical protein